MIFFLIHCRGLSYTNTILYIKTHIHLLGFGTVDNSFCDQRTLHSLPILNKPDESKQVLRVVVLTTGHQRRGAL